jgi:hypothetical protein
MGEFVYNVKSLVSTNNRVHLVQLVPMALSTFGIKTAEHVSKVSIVVRLFYPIPMPSLQPSILHLGQLLALRSIDRGPFSPMPLVMIGAKSVIILSWTGF